MSAATTTSFRPYDGEELARVADTTDDELRALLDRATAAAPMLAAASPATRCGWIYAIAEALEAHSEELVALADNETGLGSVRLGGELLRAASQLRFYADVAAEGSYLGVTIDERTDTTPRLVRVNEPLGPVAVFGASNFPFAFSVLGNDTGSALAAGCPVVVKAHPAHVQLSVRLGEIVAEVLAALDLPAGVFGLVTGQEAGAALVRADAVQAVAFTGSQQGGLALWRLANERAVVIPVFAEMGTVNPVVVTRAAARERLDEVAAGFVASFTLGSGQYCTKPGLLLVPAGHDAAQRVSSALRSAAPTPLMLTEAIAAGVRRGLTAFEEAGATVVAAVGGDAAGWSAPSAVLSAPSSAITAGSRLLEECFGPVVIVVEYADDAELGRVLGALQGSLAGTVMTGGEDVDPDAAWIVSLLARRAGRVTVNDWPTGVAFTWAQQHGGPWPATSAPAATSVGAAALDRFVRPIAYQSALDDYLPPPGRSDNPWGLPRRVDGVLERTARPTT